MTGRSPLEVIGIGIALVVMVGVGLVWGVGIVIGSIVGSVLSGRGGDWIVAMLRFFPDVGQAWEPPISSALVWTVALVVVLAFAPLVWRLVRSGGLAEEGAQWATTTDLRQAGLLVVDKPLPHAGPEEPSDAA